MSPNKVASKPAPAPVAKHDPPPPSQQDSSAFAAKIKKANADQQTRNARNARRDESGNRASERAGEGNTELRDSGQTIIQGVSQRQQQDSGDQSGSSCSQVAMADHAAEADANFLVDQLAPLTANDGIFEVLMPNGAKLAVAMKSSVNRVNILIGTDSTKLGDQLKRKKLELEQRLGRRIGKDVVLGVL